MQKGVVIWGRLSRVSFKYRHPRRRTHVLRQIERFFFVRFVSPLHFSLAYNIRDIIQIISERSASSTTSSHGQGATAVSNLKFRNSCATTGRALYDSRRADVLRQIYDCAHLRILHPCHFLCKLYTQPRVTLTNTGRPESYTPTSVTINFVRQKIVRNYRRRYSGPM